MLSWRLEGTTLTSVLLHHFTWAWQPSWLVTLTSCWSKSLICFCKTDNIQNLQRNLLRSKFNAEIAYENPTCCDHSGALHCETQLDWSAVYWRFFPSQIWELLAYCKSVHSAVGIKDRLNTARFSEQLKGVAQKAMHCRLCEVRSCGRDAVTLAVEAEGKPSSFQLPTHWKLNNQHAVCTVGGFKRIYVLELGEVLSQWGCQVWYHHACSGNKSM